MFTRKANAAERKLQDTSDHIINLLAPEFRFLILAHPVCKM
jgi:hypothetical protein